MHGRRPLVICMVTMFRKSVQILVTNNVVHVAQCPQHGPIVQHPHELIRKSSMLLQPFFRQGTTV